MADQALVVGLGVSGDAFVHHWRQRAGTVVVIDDHPTPAVRDRARRLGLDLVEAPGPAEVARLVAASDVVVPSPGVAESHPAITAALERGVAVRSELELASRWTRRPFVAVTGTNGKTTVTELVCGMLVASGRRALAAGNVGLALSDAVRRDVDVLVVEASSFQLRFTDTFRPAVAVWLNLAPDHLDWHPDVAAYTAAKARIWAHQASEDLAVANAEDAVVMEAARAAPGRLQTFGLAPGADFGVARGPGGDHLVGPPGELAAVADLPRSHPQDLANALAAAAAALGAGATVEGVGEALRSWPPLPHRRALVATIDGVGYHDDSKATNPHATLAAVAGFASVVLLAGGRNKGLDLTALAAAAPRLRAVVAFGEAGDDLVAALGEVVPVRRVRDMVEAVALARALARPGDDVLLSPACASFDQYGSYAERGEHFSELVRTLADRAPAARAPADRAPADRAPADRAPEGGPGGPGEAGAGPEGGGQR